MKRSIYIVPVCIMLVLAAGCNHGSGGGDDDDDDGGSAAAVGRARVVVNVTNPRIGTIAESESLNATTVFMLNDIVRAPIAGYIRKVNVTTGQLVKKGDVLFTIQSKEAAAIPIDTIFPSKGVITVKAAETGIVKNVDRQLGDYMQDGDGFCTIANNSSLVFMLDVPFELHNYIKPGGAYTISLPDGQKVKTHIASQIPEMDRMVQMEKYILHPDKPLSLPEGLIGTVIISTVMQTNAVILPKSAILSDETQTRFWVMKVVNDSLAVRTNIERGLQTKDSIAINSPVFTSSDRILVTGNYGVPDTLRIKIVR